MTCKKLRTKARWEQDRWLSYLPTKDDPNARYADVFQRVPTEQERLDFLRFDSHGGKIAPIPRGNPILAGKRAAAVFDTPKGARKDRVGGGGWLPYVDELKEIYLGESDRNYWPAGLMIMEDYLRRVCGLGPLRKAFGDEIVRRWLAAFLWHAFGWPDLVIRERYA